MKNKWNVTLCLISILTLILIGNSIFANQKKVIVLPIVEKKMVSVALGTMPSIPRSIKNKISFDKDRRLISCYGVMTVEERNILLRLSSNKWYRKAIHNLYRKSIQMNTQVNTQGITQLLITQLTLSGIDTPSYDDVVEESKQNWDYLKNKYDYIIFGELEKLNSGKSLTIEIFNSKKNKTVFEDQNRINIYMGNDNNTFFQTNNGKQKIILGNTQVFSLVNPVGEKLVQYFKQNEKLSLSKKRNRLELMFVVDSTKSMTDEIDLLKKNIKQVLEEIYTIQYDLEIMISIVDYKNVFDEYRVKKLPFTNNYKEIENYLNELKENSFKDDARMNDFKNGLYHGLMDQNWSVYNDDLKFIFLLTDLPINKGNSILKKQGNRISNPQFDEIVNLANSKGIRVYFVGCSGIDKESQDTLSYYSKLMGGEYINLSYQFCLYILDRKRVQFVYHDQELYQSTKMGSMQSCTRDGFNLTNYENITLGQKIKTLEEIKHFLITVDYPFEKDLDFNLAKMNNNLNHIVVNNIKRYLDPTDEKNNFERIFIKSDQYFLPVEVTKLSTSQYRKLKRWANNETNLVIGGVIVPSAPYRVKYLENNRLIEKVLNFKFRPELMKIVSPGMMKHVPQFLIKSITDINKDVYYHTENGISSKKYWFIQGELKMKPFGYR